MHLVPALFGFSGRMRRRDYWLYTVFSSTGLFILLLIDIIIPQLVFPVKAASGAPEGAAANGITVMFLLTVGLSFWMGAALLGKRLHDRDKSLIWLLAGLLPVIGWIWLFVECGCLAGTPGPNRYGVPAENITKP